MKIETNYTINATKTYEGICEVEESIWDYTKDEFYSSFVIGIPADPVLVKIIEVKNLPIICKDINYWNVYPKNIEHQKKYLGMYLDNGSWVEEDEN